MKVHEGVISSCHSFLISEWFSCKKRVNFKLKFQEIDIVVKIINFF